MRFRIWGIQITLLYSLPYLIAISNGFWIINIPKLISITNMTSPEQAMVLVFDKQSRQFKLDVGWDRFEIVLLTRRINFSRCIQWVQLLLGNIITPCAIKASSERTFAARHGQLSVYLADGYSYYRRLPMFKFKPVSGYTYYLVHTDGTIFDRRAYVAITSRVKCPTMTDAVDIITELLDISVNIGDEIKSILSQSKPLVAETTSIIKKLE